MKTKIIRVLGRDISVTTTTHTRAQGRNYFMKDKIVIDGKCSLKQQESTLLHEVMHQLMWDMNLSRLLAGREEEEILVSSLATGLFQVLKDNDILGGKK